jgi:hypothetical protein
MSLLKYTPSVSHRNNLGGYQRTNPNSPSFVMLSDPSTAFGMDEQGGIIKANGVETPVTVKRCFDSVLDSSTQTDSAASFYKESLNMTNKVETEPFCD